MLKPSAIFLAILSVLLPSHVFGAETLVKREQFKDWHVACYLDKDFCDAATFVYPKTGDTTKPDYWMRIGRHKQADNWEISVTTEKFQPRATSYFYAEAGGEGFNFTRGSTVVAFGADNEFFFMGEKANMMLGNLIGSEELRLNFEDEDVKYQTVEFSLAGLAASILWIEDQLGKVGTPRIAGAAPHNLIRTDLKLELPKSIPSELIALHARKSPCEVLEDVIHANDWEVHQLDNSKLLYMIPCASGAYNFSYSFYIEDTEYDNFTQLLFADYWDSVGWTGTDILVNPSFDPASKTISSFYKGRGIGDCGTSGLWQWTEYNFKMIKYYAKSECDGMMLGDMFPQIYPPQ